EGFQWKPLFTWYSADGDRARSGGFLSSLDLIKKMLYNTGMDMFMALADPTRRRILELLATNGELSATALYEQFPVSPQAVSQHLKVLREAHLVEMEKRAQ